MTLREYAARAGVELTLEQEAQILELDCQYAVCGFAGFAENLIGLLARWQYEKIMRACFLSLARP